jgi:hypothetical protein
MSTDQLDTITRTLAATTSRRETIRILGAGAATTFLGLFGVGCRDDGPLAVSDCTTASTCGARQYCSDDQKCLCIATAENARRCGEIPSCSAPHCTTSADCAQYGKGFFCDSPNSGCCSDGLQRCLAPCGYVAPSRGGIWAGNTTLAQTTVGVRFTVQDSNSSISGRMHLVEPGTKQLVDMGNISGRRTYNQARWTTSTGQIVEGLFSDTAFNGVMRFPARFGQPAFEATIRLTPT